MSSRNQRIAENALKDTFTLQGLTAQQPRRPNGGYDWRWKGPRNDPEWAWFFNRQKWYPALWAEFKRTQNGQYRDALWATLADWIGQHQPPRFLSFSPAWRPLEVARRLLHSWLPLRAVIHEHAPAELVAVFEKSLTAHGQHLRHHHALGGNHLVTEMFALLILSIKCDDNPCHDDWRRYALEQLDRTYREQVYPDGAFKELSSHYQKVVTINYNRLLQTLIEHREDTLVATWQPRVERLWHYMHAITMPDGNAPLNNDSDSEPYDRILKKQAPASIVAAPPQTTHFPHAGQTVFHDPTVGGWAWFDAGPRGSDHDHTDRLSFLLCLGGKPFLVDRGRYTYTPGKWRDVFVGPQAHNGVTMSGDLADQGPRTVKAPSPRTVHYRTTADCIEAAGATRFLENGVLGGRIADWQRQVLHFPSIGWVVIDRVIGFKPRELTTHWHWHPDCKVAEGSAGEQSWTVSHGDAALALRLITSHSGPTETDIRSGETEPEPIGWHSDHFNQRVPAPVLFFKQHARGPLINVWLFQASATAPLQARINADDTIELSIPADGEVESRRTLTLPVALNK